jgi:hypothetical protein
MTTSIILLHFLSPHTTDDDSIGVVESTPAEAYISQARAQPLSRVVVGIIGSV